MEKTKNYILRSFILILLITFLCGGVYTSLVTMLAQIFFKDKANGSMIEIDGINYGSSLIGQPFSGNRYMWGRFSNVESDFVKVTAPKGKTIFYPMAANISPAGIKYEKLIKQRINKIKSVHTEKENIPIPVELITGSSSGLDPHISYNTAIYQIERLERVRKMDKSTIKEIIDKCTDDKLMEMIGSKAVNVFKVNLYLDGIL